MWAMVYFRELPVPLKELDIDLLDVIFHFANTYTESEVQESYMRNRQEDESKPDAGIMRRMGYSEAEIANMDLRDATE